MTPVEFLTARYDELEGRIKAAATPAAGVTTGRRGGKSATVEYVNALGLSPDYLLADIAAKRAIIERFRRLEEQHLDDLFGVVHRHATGVLIAIRLLCLPFATHPDFDPSWVSGLMARGREAATVCADMNHDKGGIHCSSSESSCCSSACSPGSGS